MPTANAQIWYRPVGTTRLVRIDLGRRLREREGPTPRYLASQSESYGGREATRIYAGRNSVRIQLTWQRTGTDGTDSGSALRRLLHGLEAHLKRGGTCTLVEDGLSAWAAFSTRRPKERASRLPYHSPTLLDTIAPGVSPVGKEIYIQSDPDLFLTEMVLCDALVAAAPRIEFDRALVENWSDARWVLIREQGTYPSMRVPPPMRTGAFLTHRDERVFTLDLPLEEDPQELEELARSSGQIGSEISGPKGGTWQAPTDWWQGAASGVPSRFRW